MSITKISRNVIKDNTLLPKDFSQGKPEWSTSGYLSAARFYGDGSLLTGINAVDPFNTIVNVLTSGSFTGYLTADKFVGDGSLLTNIFPGVSTIVITSNLFTVEPKHNNCVVILNSLSTIDINILPLNIDFQPGHFTTFVQYNSGRGRFVSPFINNADNFFETRKQYSVCNLLNYQTLGAWTLFGDLTSTSLTAASLPISVVLTPNFTKIYANLGVAMPLSGTDLYVAGGNQYGALGARLPSPNPGYTQTFTKVTSARPDLNSNTIITNPQFIEVAPDFITSLALSTDGSLFATGGNYSGTNTGTGLIDDSGNGVFTSLFTRVTAAWDRDTITTNPKFSAISSRSMLSFALSSDGSLFVTSSFPDTRAGLGSVTGPVKVFTKILSAIDNPDSGIFVLNPKFKQISHKSVHSHALSTDGSLFASGPNSSSGYYVLGIYRGWPNTVGPVDTFTKVTDASDQGTSGPPFEPFINYTNPKFDSVAVFQTGTLALSNGAMFGVGNNSYGELGLGYSGSVVPYFRRVRAGLGFNPKFTKIVSGNFHNLALSGTDLYVCGWNSYGQLGLGDTTQRVSFTKVTTPGDKWTDIAVGAYSSYALSGNKLFVAGFNQNGELGIGASAGGSFLTFTQVTGVNIPI